MLTLIAAFSLAVPFEAPKMNVLVYSKTGGFRHDSIPTGHEMFKELAAEKGFSVVGSEDASVFSSYNLQKYDAVVFLNTTGDILTDSGQKALQEFIEHGGGYVGIHAAADTEYNWPWYETLAGAWFMSHPQIQDAEIKIEQSHPTTAAWPTEPFKRKDEWYDFKKSPRGNVTVLASLNEKSYQGGKMNGDHPIIWCRELGKGRSWYTGFGHTKETYAEKPFRTMIYQALLWVTHK